MSNEVRIQFALLSTALLFLVAGALFQQKTRETPTVLDDLDLNAPQAIATAPVVTAGMPEAPEDASPAPSLSPPRTPDPVPVSSAPAPAETTYR